MEEAQVEIIFMTAWFIQGVYQQNIAQSVPPYFDILVSLVMIIWIVEKSYYMKRIFMRWVNFTSTNYSLFWFCYILREWGPKKMQEEKFH